MCALQLPWIPMCKLNVADLQDFDISDTKETPLKGRKEEKFLDPVQSNFGKKPYKKQTKNPRSSN